jgi:CelD/BcsL family acetyltransferase involved in cellulose biosynthesis
MNAEADFNLEVSLETWQSFAPLWGETLSSLPSTCPFILPHWLRVWWDHFGEGFSPLLLSIKRSGQCLGLAPLMARSGSARFMGSPDVCDFQECVFPKGREEYFFRMICDRLQAEGIGELVLEPLREDTGFFRALSGMTAPAGSSLTIQPLGVLLEMPLPASWEDYLQGLSGKDRHEIRRKLRRLEEAGPVGYRLIEEAGPLDQALPIFLELFRSSRPDKKEFMTENMASFFKSLARELAQAGLLRLYFLDLHDRPVAAVFCFDYGSTLFLYNNGFDDSQRSLSLGLASKLFTIRDSIRTGRRFYSFLKGDEAYKHRLGGKPVSLYQYRLSFSSI